jgi:toxin CcdB
MDCPWRNTGNSDGPLRGFRTRDGSLLLLDLQSTLLDNLPTRVVAPLHPIQEMTWSMGRLTPRFNIRGEIYVLATHRMAAVMQDELGSLVADLSAHADEITAATDFLFQGF